MPLDWIPRDNELKSHQIFGDENFGTEAPCTMFEKKPLVNPNTGETVEGLYTAWVTLNNPAQFGSYTTEMVKGVIAGMHKASMDRSIVATIFTGIGDRAFCTGGNVKEYAEYYTKRPKEYADYIDLFAGMVDGILKSRVPVIQRANGMRVAGGQEIGQACDLTVAADTAQFGQAGTKHGSTPTGGSSDFLPWMLPTVELAMWNCFSNEMWSAYKMERYGHITKTLPIKKNAQGEWVRDPRVITDKYLDDGEIVYGEMKKGDELKEATGQLRELQTDFSLLDSQIDKMVWTMANLMPLCEMMTIESIRMKKKYFWDQTKVHSMYWLAANMNTEAWLGFNAFNTADQTGQREVDFIKLRQLIAEGHQYDDDLMEAVMPKPKQE
ncbi:MAG: 6-oxocyclohex-1-ene-1-carbonyl-CoA hydratase [Dehalococcoidales bacterium]|jgi:6-oxo-cyclohex-1-ene-carbonyl-CoA hydrolase|nr:6-oxocyclohex-1-ene-1-carbonyl-CoA hydratase [Dehalococcoidales bacterium]MDP6631920.1 6-oxocyclohex-1-ene-1-carbonyl-CoA hydratase [Dehalococcoidales bacterium]